MSQLACIEMSMSVSEPLRRTVTVQTAHGLHLSPCSKVAGLAQKFSCRVELINGSVRADAKSILDLMTLAAGHGTVLDLEVEGADADVALGQLGELFDSVLVEER